MLLCACGALGGNEGWGLSAAGEPRGGARHVPERELTPCTSFCAPALANRAAARVMYLSVS
jgi:hypothetical protein